MLLSRLVLKMNGRLAICVYSEGVHSLGMHRYALRLLELRFQVARKSRCSGCCIRLLRVQLHAPAHCSPGDAPLPVPNAHHCTTSPLNCHHSGPITMSAAHKPCLLPHVPRHSLGAHHLLTPRPMQRPPAPSTFVPASTLLCPSRRCNRKL